MVLLFVFAHPGELLGAAPSLRYGHLRARSRALTAVTKVRV